MKDAQQILCVFYAITWGVVGNVQPRWKAFHFAVTPYLAPATHRICYSFFYLNLLPIFFFCLALWFLNDARNIEANDDLWSVLILALMGITPSFAVFGFYRLWLSVIESCPTYFYSRCSSELPEEFMEIEPNLRDLNTRYIEASKLTRWPNFLFGSLYVILAFCITALLKYMSASRP